MGSSLVTSRTALADRASEAQAVQLFNEGRAAFDKKQFERAAQLFESSLQNVPSPNSRLYLGRAYRELGKTASAYAAFTRAAGEASDAVANGQPRYRSTADAAANEAKMLEPSLPHVVLDVTGATKDVHVMLDGTEIASASFGLPINVDPGEHKVKGVANRAKPFETTVTAAAGQTARVNVVLAAIPISILRVELADRPYGYAATLDGKALDLKALEAPIETTPGEHTLVVTAPGRTAFSWTGTIQEDKTAEVTASLPTVRVEEGVQPKKPFPKAPFFVLGGASVVALGAGAALGVVAKTTSSAEQAKAVNDRTPKQRDNVKTYARTADILFVTGGVLLAGTGVVGYFTWKGELFHKQETTARVVPWVGPQGGGLVGGGTF